MALRCPCPLRRVAVPRRKWHRRALPIPPVPLPPEDKLPDPPIASDLSRTSTHVARCALTPSHATCDQATPPCVLADSPPGQALASPPSTPSAPTRLPSRARSSAERMQRSG